MQVSRSPGSCGSSIASSTCTWRVSSQSSYCTFDPLTRASRGFTLCNRWYGLGEGEYCCPHAKHCLRPIKGKTCGNNTACDTGETCCPLTKLCVTVHAPCTPPPSCPRTAYCCPDARRCMTPTNPGLLCRSRLECASDEICCPTTHECVSVGGECQSPIENKTSWLLRQLHNESQILETRLLALEARMPSD